MNLLTGRDILWASWHFALVEEALWHEVLLGFAVLNFVERLRHGLASLCCIISLFLNVNNLLQMGLLRLFRILILDHVLVLTRLAEHR